MVSRRKILSRSRDDLTLGEERTKHTQVVTNAYGQFVEGGKNGNLMSFFFKVEPLCDQT